jgi:hypothetical protein
MLSAVITALLLCVMLLIIGRLFISALRGRKRQMLAQATRATEAQESTQPLNRPVRVVLQVQDGILVGFEKPLSATTFTLPSSWYSRHRKILSSGLMLMLLLTLFVQSGLADGALQNLTRGIGISILSYSQPIDVHPVAHPVPVTASMLLMRVDSADRDQYYSDYQWQVWSYSSCSGIAMEMVMDAYGRNLIAAEVLQVELNLGVWNAYGGLLRENGIAMTANYFGFNTDASHSRTLQDLITISNKGMPIIVSVRDSYHYPGGHLFVIRGGDSQYVFIADSSPANFQSMSHAMFLGMWQGFSAILTPR